MERTMDENRWGFEFNEAEFEKARNYFFKRCVRNTSHETFLRWVAVGLLGKSPRKLAEAVDDVVNLHRDCLQDYGLMDMLIAMIGEAGVDGLINEHYCAVDVAQWWLDLELETTEVENE